MNIEKREHIIWKEGAHKVLGHPIVGQWQYIYSTDNGKISLVQIYGYPLNLGESHEDSYKHFQWEIYDLGKSKKSLFEDVERFDTKEQAEERIKGLLN